MVFYLVVYVWFIQLILSFFSLSFSVIVTILMMIVLRNYIIMIIIHDHDHHLYWMMVYLEKYFSCCYCNEHYRYKDIPSFFPLTSTYGPNSFVFSCLVCIIVHWILFTIKNDDNRGYKDKRVCICLVQCKSSHVIHTMGRGYPVSFSYYGCCLIGCGCIYDERICHLIM